MTRNTGTLARAVQYHEEFLLRTAESSEKEVSCRSTGALLRRVGGKSVLADPRISHSRLLPVPLCRCVLISVC
jgi:hypothetical protein